MMVLDTISIAVLQHHPIIPSVILKRLSGVLLNDQQRTVKTVLLKVARSKMW